MSGKDYNDPYYKKEIKIRGRGHFTLVLKKPFQIKFDKKVSFFDMKEDKKWVLLANYLDKTMSRTAISYEMGYLSNLDWTANSDFSEVFLNGKYWGLYNLMERKGKDFIKNNHGEKDVDMLTSEDAKVVTGNISEYDQLMFDIAQNDITTVETVLYGNNYNNEKNGYKTLIDIDSFVDWVLINEISKNNDANNFKLIYA